MRGGYWVAAGRCEDRGQARVNRDLKRGRGLDQSPAGQRAEVILMDIFYLKPWPVFKSNREKAKDSYFLETSTGTRSIRDHFTFFGQCNHRYPCPMESPEMAS